MSRLITTSLIGAIDWCRTAPTSHIDRDTSKPTWREQAFIDLKKTLARDYSTPPSPAMTRGIEFENQVYAQANREPNEKGSDHFRWFVEQCRGGQFQRKTKKYITIDDVEYCLYGKIDAWWPYIIKDIKGTGSWKGNNNYLKTFQHKLYCYTEHIDSFTYLVAVFAEDSKTITERHEVHYHVDDFKVLEEEVIETVKDAVRFLEMSSDLFELYTTKFSLY